jgi:hypothetical protein
MAEDEGKKEKEKAPKMMTLLWMESKSCNDPGGSEESAFSDKRASFAMNKLDFPVCCRPAAHT